MTKGLHRARRKAPPQGIGLAFLALAVQALLPFVIAYEITFASTSAAAEGTTIICAVAGPTASSASHQVDHTSHHGLADGCPICLALAAGQAFIAAAPVALPLPQAASIVLRLAAHAPRASAGFSASYNPRAPPFTA